MTRSCSGSCGSLCSIAMRQTGRWWWNIVLQKHDGDGVPTPHVGMQVDMLNRRRAGSSVNRIRGEDTWCIRMCWCRHRTCPGCPGCEQR